MRKVKIAFTLQLSAYDSVTERFFLTKDSNWNLVCNAIAGMQKNFPEWTYVIFVPPADALYEQDQVKTNGYSALLTAVVDKTSLEFIEYEYPAVIYPSRYHFNFPYVENLIRDAKFDILWINDPCHVLAWKTTLLHMGLLDKVIVCTYHSWIDIPSSPKIDQRCSYLTSQASGSYYSDIALFNSDSAINQFLEGCSTMFNAEFVHTLSTRCVKLPPAIDINKILSLKPIAKPASTPTIVFNHRLSSHPYYRSNWELFFKLCSELHDENVEFRVICTDHIAYETFELARRGAKNIELYKYDYDSYIRALWDADIAIGLFQDPGMWSIALTEAMATQCATIVPDHSGFKELIPPDYLAKWSIKDEIKPLLYRLIKDTSFRSIVTNQAYSYAKSTHDNSIVMKTFTDKILDMLETKLLL